MRFFRRYPYGNLFSHLRFRQQISGFCCSGNFLSVRKPLINKLFRIASCNLCRYLFSGLKRPFDPNRPRDTIVPHVSAIRKLPVQKSLPYCQEIFDIIHAAGKIRSVLYTCYRMV